MIRFKRNLLNLGYVKGPIVMSILAIIPSAAVLTVMMSFTSICGPSGCYDVPKVTRIAGDIYDISIV